MFGRFASALFAVSFIATTGCTDPVAFEEPFTADATLGGKTISASSLSNGRQMYVRQCYACHGLEGDGRGPSSPGLRPAPRDLRLAKYKFVRMVDGDLPTDKMLYDVIRGGLHGTAMLPWDIQDDALYDIINYIKTFSPDDEGWRDPENEIAKPISLSEDPWTGKAEEAVAYGKNIYHGLANCQSCHPAYATKAYIHEAFVSADKKPELRDDPYHSAKQVTEYEVLGVEQTNMPPDYTLNPTRSIRADPGEANWDRKNSLYRIIGAGVNGTAMAAWQGTLDEKDLWAVAYYVDSLMALKGTSDAMALKAELLAQGEWTPPAEEDSAAEDPEADQPAE